MRRAEALTISRNESAVVEKRFWLTMDLGCPTLVDQVVQMNNTSDMWVHYM